MTRAQVPDSDAGWFSHPNPTQSLFLPRGRTLSKGEKYFALREFFFPSLTIGLTDRIEIGGGMSIFPWLSAKNQLFYVMPRVALVRSALVNISAGALAVKPRALDQLLSSDNSTSSTVGLVFGNGTVGNEDANLSLGAGYGFSGGKLSQSPVLSLGGELRVISRMSLITENWIIPGEGTLFGFGLRFMSHNASFDIAAMTTSDPGAGFIPFGGVTLGF